MDYILIFIIGAIFGSFYSLITIRLPEGESIVLPNSHCRNCNSNLKVKDLIPIISFLFLKGKCRYCNKDISKRYLFIEMLTGTVFIILYYKFKFSIDFILYVILFSMLIIVSVIDYFELVIYDSIIYAYLICINILLILTSRLGLFNFYGAITGYLFYFCIYFLTKNIYKREVFGLGDVVLLSAIGFVVGSGKILLIGAFSFYVGIILYFIYKIIINSQRKEVPFIPAIAITSFVVVFFDEIFILFLGYIF